MTDRTKILSVYGPEFGLSNPSQDLQLSSTQSRENGQVSTRYQQIHKGIPILAGEVIVNMDDRGGLLSMSGEISPDLDLSTEPTLSAEEAAGIAVGVVAKQYGLEPTALKVSDPELWIYDQRLLEPSDRPVELVWRMEVIGLVRLDIRELVLVNADLGGVSLHFNQVDTFTSFQGGTGIRAHSSNVANTTTPSSSSTLAPTQTPTPSPAFSSTTFAGRLQPFARTQEWAALVARTQQSGELRIIVQLKVPFVPEGHLKTVADAQLQRQQIKQAQVQLPSQLGISNAQVHRTFKALPLIVLTVDQDGLQKLAQSNLVLGVQEDVPSPPVLDLSIPLIGADDAWAAGYSGSGQVVAILDTGMDRGHEFLAGKVVAEACFSTTNAASSSLCPDATDEQIGSGAGINCPSVVKGCDHGTHVAGIAAGNVAGLAGVAKDAQLISIQVFSRFDSTANCGVGNTPCALAWTSDQIAALDWLYSQSGTYQIAAANMSLGGSTAYSSPCDGDSRKSAIDQLRSVDIATVIASANSGIHHRDCGPRLHFFSDQCRLDDEFRCRVKLLQHRLVHIAVSAGLISVFISSWGSLFKLERNFYGCAARCRRMGGDEVKRSKRHSRRSASSPHFHWRIDRRYPIRWIRNRDGKNSGRCSNRSSFYIDCDAHPDRYTGPSRHRI